MLVLAPLIGFPVFVGFLDQIMSMTMDCLRWIIGHTPGHWKHYWYIFNLLARCKQLTP